MPVRFRCAYCNQLLGISRRKAGTVVRCPTCAGQVVVPNTSEPEAAQQPQAQGKPQLFERSDFDELFNPPGVQEQPVSLPPDAKPSPVAAGAGAPVGAWGTHAEPAFDVENLGLQPLGTSATRASNGIVLSPTKATVLTVLVIVAVALAFGAGLLVGRTLGT